jgi:hypothetical protein
MQEQGLDLPITYKEIIELLIKHDKKDKVAWKNRQVQRLCSKIARNR